MVAPVKLTPQMDSSTLTNAINDTFNQIETENRVKVIRDSDGLDRMVIGQWDNTNYGILGSDPKGIRRILIGQNPKTGASGIWVSKENVDVIAELMA